MANGRSMVTVCASLTFGCLQPPPDLASDGGTVDPRRIDAAESIDSSSTEIDGSVSPSGLVAHYPFDGVNGSFVFDMIGNRHGTCTVCPGVVAAGQIDTALAFNGSQWLEIADDAAFHLEEATVTMWVRRDDVDDYQALVGKAINSGVDNSWEMYLSDAGGLVGQVYTDSPKIFYGSPIAKDEWIHIALSWDSEKAVLYINGESVDPEQLGQSPGFDDNPIAIGVGYDNGVRVNYYSGYLDDLRIYDHVLDSTELGMLVTPTTN